MNFEKKERGGTYTFILIISHLEELRFGNGAHGGVGG